MAVSPKTIVLGTHNRKKGLELAQLLVPFGLQVLTLADFDHPLEVDETGETFAENAALKACQQARHLQCWVLGEDSGLSVDALGGRPGVYSAHYAGPAATDDDNIDKLLDEMRGKPPEQRTAHYISHMSLSDPRGQLRAESQASCNGRLATERRGSAGFGYDPVFEIREYHRTFGELGDAVKAMLSHRGRAARLMLPQVAQLLREDQWS